MTQMNFVEFLRKKSAMKTFLCEKCCFLAEKWQFYGCKYKDFAFSGIFVGVNMGCRLVFTGTFIGTFIGTFMQRFYPLPFLMGFINLASA